MLDWWNNFAGIGGWFFFLLLDVGLTSWLLFDSAGRKSPTIGWRVAIIVFSLLILPAPIVNRLGLPATNDVREYLSWVGVVFGGVLPLAATIGYIISVATAPPPPGPITDEHTTVHPPPKPTPRPSRPEASGSLVMIEGDSPGREYRLLRGDVRIGRRRDANDISFDSDKAVSREHALIREDKGYFTLYDRGSTTGTFVNSHRLTGPVLLEHGDEIQLGETKLRFVKLN